MFFAYIHSRLDILVTYFCCLIQNHRPIFSTRNLYLNLQDEFETAPLAIEAIVLYSSEIVS